MTDFSEDGSIDDEADEADEEVDDADHVIELESRDEDNGGNKCLCGEKREYWECKYLNPQARWRARWVRDRLVNKQVQAAMKNPLTWARVKDSIHQRNAAAIGELMSCTPPPQAGDNPKSVIISNGCTLNGQQQTYATRWVVSPLNDFHICNDRHRFLELDATVDHVTYNGKQMEILGYGKAWLHVQRNTYDFRKIVLTHVAYIPKFLSVIAMRRVEELKMSHRHPQIFV